MWIGAVIGGVMGLVVTLPLLYIMLHPESRPSDYYYIGVYRYVS